VEIEDVDIVRIEEGDLQLIQYWYGNKEKAITT
jgi:hypothetical protein